MKRFVLVVCMAMIVFALFACGKSKDDPQATDGLNDTEAGIRATPGDTSGQAVAAEQPPISDSEAFAKAEEIIKNMTLQEKVGQMFLADLSQLDTAKKPVAKRYHFTDKMKETLQNYHIGGVYLSDKNIKNEKQTKKLISDLQASVSGAALYIAAEEEGGGAHSLAAKVEDMTETGTISATRMGSDLTEEQVYEEGARIAHQLCSWGFNMNLAPVADIASEKNLDYAVRCFGSDTDLISARIDNIIRGMRDYGLTVSLKYFPGIGDVSGDYSQKILDNTDSLMTLRNKNFTVYSNGIKSGADCVMMSNTAVSKITIDNKLPAFLSEEIVTDLLRTELGFEGVIMTPPLNMKSVTQNYTVEYVVAEAVKSGCDMIVLPVDVKKGCDALVDAVIAGEIDEKRINTSVRRILQNKIQRGILVTEP